MAKLILGNQHKDLHDGAAIKDAAKELGVVFGCEDVEHVWLRLRKALRIYLIFLKQKKQWALILRIVLHANAR
jgi:hypothetical protein